MTGEPHPAFASAWSPVADGPEELTDAWLSRALGRHVSGVAAERIGTGQTGATYRLSIDTADGPSTLIAKVAAGDSAARRRVRNGYRSEVGFYRDIASTVDVAIPRCWYGAITDDSLAFTLLLDDLSPRVPGVQAQGCTIEQARSAVSNLAALHAGRWNDESIFDLAFVARPNPAGADHLGSIVAAATDTFVERFATELDDTDVATLRAVAAVMTEWHQARPDPFAVLHGDYRLDNLLFDPDGRDVVAVDWQTLAVGPPARDLAFFLGTSLTIDDRRAAERELVAGYHAALCARGVSGYGAGQCFDDYRLGQLQGPMITTMGCAFATGERSAAADGMFLAMARRSCAAIRDLDSLELVGRE
ncbi:MAG: phosphotransferase [Ilumatobacteraceae bacterium]